MANSISVYLINLERSDQRRAAMITRLTELKFDYVWFKAVDGTAAWDQLKGDINQPAFRRNTGREIMKGEIGTYHSHLGVWQTFIDADHEVALVLEDDVVFHDDFLDAINLALEAKDRWDFLKLNKIRAKQPVSRGKIGQYDLNAYVGAATGLGAYLIKRDLAARLLPKMLPITRPIDHELDLVFKHRFRHLGIEPFPSHVDDGNESTITGIGFAGVKKFPKWRRLPSYMLRLTNFLRKWYYLRNTNIR